MNSIGWQKGSSIELIGLFNAYYNHSQWYHERRRASLSWDTQKKKSFVKLIKLMNNVSKFFWWYTLHVFLTCYGILSLDGHTVVVSLTFSTDLVITFSFLLASPEGTDATGDGAVVPSATPISWKTRLWLNGEFFQKERKKCTSDTIRYG